MAIDEIIIFLPLVLSSHVVQENSGLSDTSIAFK